MLCVNVCLLWDEKLRPNIYGGNCMESKGDWEVAQPTNVSSLQNNAVKLQVWYEFVIERQMHCRYMDTCHYIAYGLLASRRDCFLSIDIAFIRYSGIQKIKRVFTLRVSCTVHLGFIIICQWNERKKKNMARPSESRPTEKIYFHDFRSVPYNHTECLSVAKLHQSIQIFLCSQWAKIAHNSWTMQDSLTKLILSKSVSSSKLKTIAVSVLVIYPCSVCVSDCSRFVKLCVRL